jgi:glycosyltransferase involved in cell wall biosynthesis
LNRIDTRDRRIVKTIPNVIDLNRFSFCGPDLSGPAVFAGRLAPEKDVATLLRAARHVATVRPQFRLAIAGSGPCEAELKDLAAKLRVEGVVEFLGEVRDMPALLRRASLFVLPSITEGLPLTVLEAMACGLPVVATSVGGTPEAVDDGVSGLLVPSGDAAALADALLRVHSNADEVRAMGLAGRRRVQALFDVRSMVLQYESTYRQVLESLGVGLAA